MNRRAVRPRNTRYKQKKRFRRWVSLGCLLLVVVGLIVYFLNSLHQYSQVKDTGKPDMNVDLLTVNEYSRPGEERSQINGIVIHYVANPGSTAKQNRDYFESLMTSHITKASSHFVVGLDGEIVQCIPTKEIAYASNNRNIDTIAIEVCHPDESGKFNKKSYESTVKLTAWLCGKFNIKSDEIIRHYDVTGKNCPKYYVEHPKAWKKFKKEVKSYIEKYGE